MTYKGSKSRSRFTKPNQRRAMIMNNILRLARWRERVAGKDFDPAAESKFLHDNAQEFDKLIDNIVYWSNKKPTKNRMRDWYQLTKGQQKKFIHKMARRKAKKNEFFVKDFLYRAGIFADEHTRAIYDNLPSHPYRPMYSRRRVVTFQSTPQNRLYEKRRDKIRSLDLGLIARRFEFIINLHPDDVEILPETDISSSTAVISTDFYKASKLLDDKILASVSYMQVDNNIEVFYVAKVTRTRGRKDENGETVARPSLSINKGYIASYLNIHKAKREATGFYLSAKGALGAARQQIALDFAAKLAPTEEELAQRF